MHAELIKKLNYEFIQPELLTIALTHRSKGSNHNERFEFLGDAVVNFVIADILFHQYPSATEGELSRWRATLVNRDTLAELGRNFDLSQYVLLGHGELRSGGNQRHSILSCAMEAVIGAVFLDGGFDVVRKKIMEWYQPLLLSLSSAASHKDPKTVLQEFLQRHRKSLPVYRVVGIAGEAHQQIFNVSCEVAGAGQVLGKGTTRRRAEQEAALAMLEVLRK
ncbi:MAG TPA: ribonuclease III [Gammaproteobacteria bacterium]|jgi:ribonuclease-3|nr:ribonuclease III [Gammaproteobacteria bacterium]